MTRRNALVFFAALLLGLPWARATAAPQGAAAVQPAAEAAQASEIGAVEPILRRLYLSDLEAAARFDEWAAELCQMAEENLDSPLLGTIYNRILELYDEAGDPEPIDEFFKSFADREIPNGLVKLAALAGKRWVLMKQGRIEEARDVDAFSAYARTVIAAGPFGFGTSSLHDTAFEPETSVDLNAVYRQFGRDVGWRMVTRRADTPQIAPYRYLSPNAGCAYAVYQFHLPEPAAALITFAYQGSAKVWLNGAQIADWNRSRTQLPRQSLIPVRAAAGWNRILIKLSSGQAPFALAVVDRTGHPFPALTECAELVLHPAGAGGGLDEEFDPAAINPTDFLIAHVERFPDSLAARLALAAALDDRGLPSQGISEARAARELNPGSAHSAYLLGELYGRAGYLPQTVRHNREKEMLEEAVRLDSNHLPALRALAVIDHENDRSEQAVAALRGVLSRNPDYFAAHAALAEVFGDLNWSREYRDSLEAACAAAPRRVLPLENLADYYENLGRLDLAQEYLRTALQLNRGQTDIMQKIAAYAWDHGDEQEAVELFERVADITDSDADRRRLAELYRLTGNPEAGRAILEQLRRDHPGDTAPLLTLAAFLVKEGRSADAVPLYEEALALAPELHDVRALLREMKVSGHDDPVFESFTVDGRDYMNDLPGKAEFPKASSIVALDHMITRVYPDGSSIARVHQVVKILDKDAVEQYGRLHIPGRIEILRTIAPDGRMLEPINAEESGDYNMPGVEVGALVESCFTLRESNSLGRPLETGRFYFQDVKGQAPFLFSRYVIILPAKMEIEEELHVPAMFEREVEHHGEDIVYVYTARNTPVAELENLMPPEEEVFPNVNLVQYRDWDQVAQILANIHDRQVVLYDEIREKAAEVISGREGDAAAAAKALYDFVNEYVKSDDGSDDAVEVLAEGQGNRAALFMALLDAAGIEYDYLRCGVNPGYLGTKPDWSKVDLGLLPQELIRVRTGGDGEEILVSMHSRMAPFGEIPYYLSGAAAVPVTGRPERIDTLPGLDPALCTDIDVTLNVAVNGRDADIDGRLVFPGFGRVNIQEQLQKVDTVQRRQFFERGLLRIIYPGARVLELDISGVDEVGASPTFAFKLQARDFVHPAGDVMACALLPEPPELTRGFIRKPDRNYDMVRRTYSRNRVVMNVDLGTAYRLERLPASIVERGFFLNYSLLTARTERGYTLEQTIEFVPGDVATDRYRNFIEMLSAVDERTMEPVVLEPISG